MAGAAKKTAAPHTPFVGPAALASLHMLAVTEGEGYFATVEADDFMDPYKLGHTRAGSLRSTRRGARVWSSIPIQAS